MVGVRELRRRTVGVGATANNHRAGRCNHLTTPKKEKEKKRKKRGWSLCTISLVSTLVVCIPYTGVKVRNSLRPPTFFSSSSFSPPLFKRRRLAARRPQTSAAQVNYNLTSGQSNDSPGLPPSPMEIGENLKGRRKKN